MAINTISQTGINLIKKFEGLHKVGANSKVTAYLCPANVWTIGYGHTKDVTKGMTITKSQADEFLEHDLVEFAGYVTSAVKVPLNQPQFDALVSFVFNVGPGNFKSSTLLKKLNKKDYAAVPAEFMKWNKARVNGKLVALEGLTRRRTAEAALFAYDAPLGDVEPLPQAPVVVAPTPLVKSRTLWGTFLAFIGTIGSISEIAPVLSETASKIQPFTASSKYIAYAFTALTLAGIGLAAFSKIKSQMAASK